MQPFKCWDGWCWISFMEYFRFQMNKFDVTLHFFLSYDKSSWAVFLFVFDKFFFSRCISALVIASRARKQATEKQFSFFCLSFCICFAVCRSSQNNMVEAKSFVSLAPKWISKSRKWQRKPKKNNAPVTSRTLNTTDKSKKKHILINCCYLCSLVFKWRIIPREKKKIEVGLAICVCRMSVFCCYYFTYSRFLRPNKYSFWITYAR